MGMLQISIIKETKDYFLLKVPRPFMRQVNFDSMKLTETEALKILRGGMKEYRQKKTYPLQSLRSLRGNGHRV